MWILITMLVIAAFLVAYTKIESRINQRPCSSCGFRVSKDGPDEDCPNCGTLIPAITSSR